MSLRLIVTLGLTLLLFAVPQGAQANGQRDLEAGIAFYDSLDLERARTYLVAASRAKDLPASARATALLYIGMLEYELGEKVEADAAWTSAFALAPKTAAPDGTSPKTISAMQAVRLRPRGTDVPKVVDPVPPVATEVPTLRAPDTKPSLVPPPPVEKDDYGSIPVWVGVTTAVVVSVVLLGVLASGGDDSGCARASGAGCLNVTIQ